MRKIALFLLPAVALATPALMGLAQASDSTAAVTGKSVGHAHSIQAPETRDTVYKAIKPCRVADTRQGSNTPLTSGTAKAISIAGAGQAAQGGSGAGCGIPAYATSVALSLTSTGAAGKGYLHAWAAGTDEPSATVLNYTKLTDLTVGATIPFTAIGGIEVKAFGGSTDLVVDAVGYNSPQIQAQVNAGGTTFYDASRLSFADAHPNPGIYVLAGDRPITNCTPVISLGVGETGFAVGTTNGSAVTVKTYSFVGGVPTLQDAFFSIAVIC